MQGKFLTTSWEKNSLVLILLLGFIQSQESNQIYGFITDENSGEVLIGANVFIQETGQGMATDINGYYVLSEIELNEVTLVVSYVGYKRFEQIISFKESSIKELERQRDLLNVQLKSFDELKTKNTELIREYLIK